MADVLGSIQIQALPAANPVDGTELLHIKQGTGDRRCTIIDAMKPHTEDLGNPHQTDASQVGLGNVTNDAQLTVFANLADVPNKVTARTNLQVYSKVESDAKLKVHTDRTDNPHGTDKNQVGLSNILNYGLSNNFWENADKYSSARAVYALFRAVADQNPVGSVYLSFNATNPTSYLLCGGTWVLESQGSALVGAISGDNSRPAGTRFGSSNKQIAVQNLPRHTHTVTLYGGDHAHRVWGYTYGSGAHSHNYSGTTSNFDYGSKYGTTNGGGNHQHTGNTNLGGNHRHTYAGDDQLSFVAEVAQNNIGRYDSTSSAGENAKAYWTSWSGDHSHSFATTWSGEHTHDFGVYIGAHGHTYSGTTSQQDDHQHGIDFYSQNSTHTHTGTTDQTGSDVALNVEQPSMVLYVWRRTA